MDTVSLQNISDVDQHATTPDGKRHTLIGYEVRILPRDVADAFLYQRGKYVRPYRAVSIPPSMGEPTMWLANATGNPFLDKKLKRTKHNRETGVEEEYEIDNPLCVARPIQREMQSEQKIVDGASGFKESVSAPPKKFAIPPYMRLPVGRSSAEWLLRRDAQMDEATRGALVECRAPSDFEPNDSWGVEEIYLYAQEVDSRVSWRKNWPATEHNRESKLVLLQALFFRLIDDRYALPTRDRFQVIVDEATSAKKGKTVADSPNAKNRHDRESAA